MLIDNYGYVTITDSSINSGRGCSRCCLDKTTCWDLYLNHKRATCIEEEKEYSIQFIKAQKIC